MINFAVAFAVLAHVSFWGAGLAILAMPNPWRRFWPVLVITAGFALQSAVVWIGAYAGLHGTNRYAWLSEVIPVALLVFGLWRIGLRRARIDFGRFGLVWGAVLVALAVLVLPLAIASHGLTTISLGSCDAADYAAGARVFMEYARSDRSGFLGLTDVVRVMSVDNFFDFWLRLNHFTPSALMALNGSILDCAPHELASALTMVVMAGTIPVVFWMARAVFGYTAAASIGIAALFGMCPIPWYSVAQVSPAPLLASQAIALLNWAGIALWRGRLTWRRGFQFGGVLAIGYSLVLGSYNFILVVSLVPCVAYAGMATLQDGLWPRFMRWLAMVLMPLVICGLFFWARVAGLIERFTLFQTYDFGWHIPVLSPEGWLGMVRGGTLLPWWGPLRWLLAAAILVGLGWAAIRAIWAGQRRFWIVVAATVPVLIGYAFLEVRGARLHTNASYDAFKLFTVFFPLLLPAFCWWLTLRWSTRLVQWFAVAGAAIVVFAFNLLACVMGIVQLSRPPLMVSGPLREVRQIESMADVASVNMLVPDMWSRLWANEFLLRKPQYFRTHTYEGRLNTPLRGEWDLLSGVLHVDLGEPGTRVVNQRYSLVDTRAPNFVRAFLDDGWYGLEHLADGPGWRWTKQDAVIRVENPHEHPITVVVTLDGRGYGERELGVVVHGGVPTAYAHLGAKRSTVVFPALTVPPGESRLVLHSPQPAERPPADARSLSVCVFSLTVSPQP